MGIEVCKSRFSADDFQTFRTTLRKETATLKRAFDQSEFVDTGKVIGLELETWLTDQNFIPSPENDLFIAKMQSPLLVPELSQFNAEINTPPVALHQDAFSVMEGQLLKTWTDVQRTAHRLNRHMVLIGSLPTLRDEMLTPQYMSNLSRYRAFNEEIFRVRRGNPIALDIRGKDHLQVQHSDIMLEAAATSLQIHFQVEPEKTPHYFNASLMASAPMVALCANSPFLFGKELWSETRIPIFEQSLDLPGYASAHGTRVKRVTFGSGYVRRSIMELFLENIDGFPPLLPILYDDTNSFAHVKLHNGSIWRWNRPIVDCGPKGPTIRIEHRVPSAGPTITDAVANMAFYIGLTHSLAVDIEMQDDLESWQPFPVTERNFYHAARHGFAAPFSWQRKQHELQRIILDVFLPMARDGLTDLGVQAKDIDYYLNDVIYHRILTGQNGSSWQKSWIATHGSDFQGLTEAYYRNQESNLPVCLWKV